MGDVLTMRKEPLKKYGCSRAQHTPNALIFIFNRAPSDEEMRLIDDVMARTAALVGAVVRET